MRVASCVASVDWRCAEGLRAWRLLWYTRAGSHIECMLTHARTHAQHTHTHSTHIQHTHTSTDAHSPHIQHTHTAHTISSEQNSEAQSETPQVHRAPYSQTNRYCSETADAQRHAVAGVACAVCGATRGARGRRGALSGYN